jgi:hypothetical protein
MAARIPLTPDQSAFVASRVQRFHLEAPRAWQWQVPYVARFGALPLYLGWTETLALQPEGRVVRWSTEQAYEGLKLVDEPIELAIALVCAAQQHSILRDLVPSRPHEAAECHVCAGVGHVAQQPELICECGGLGWRPGSVEALGLVAE